MSQSLKSALRASLESDLGIVSGTDNDAPTSADAAHLPADGIVEIGDEYAVDPAALIQATVQGNEVATALDEVADAADSLVGDQTNPIDEDTLPSDVLPGEGDDEAGGDEGAAAGDNADADADAAAAAAAAAADGDAGAGDGPEDKFSDDDEEVKASAESAAMLTMNMRHILAPLRLGLEFPAMESNADVKAHHRQLSKRCRTMAAIVRKDTRNLRVSQEGHFTFNFKSFDGKIKDAQERVTKYSSGLDTKIADLNDNPVPVRHQVIYKLLTQGGKVVDDKADVVLKATLDQLDKLSSLAAPLSDVVSQLDGLAATITDAESGAAAIEKAKALKNPWPQLNAAVNGNRGIDLMGNVRITGEQVSGTKNMGGWTVSGYLDITKDNEAEGNKVGKLWKAAGVIAGYGVASALVGLAAPAVVIGAGIGAAKGNIDAMKGWSVKSNISVTMLKSMVQQVEHLIGEVTKDRAEFLKLEEAYGAAFDKLKAARAQDKAASRALLDILEQAYDLAATTEYAVTKHRLWLINTVLMVVQFVEKKTQ